jgi:pre-mRNA-processing factor 17
LHPSADPDKSHNLLAGCSDRVIYQFDTDSGEIIQRYDMHRAAVNTITFVDDNQRFFSTSDDKSIRVWDYGVPFSVKFFSDPSMHSMPATYVRPDKRHILLQSLNNEIHTYHATDKFGRYKKKTFAGHLTAGYACGLSSSPDGKYVCSGDGNGHVYLWDWKSGKIARTLQKAHASVCIDVAWHPFEASKLFTCGWDGALKIWD